MRIVDVRETVVPIRSAIRNAYVIFRPDDGERGGACHRRGARHRMSLAIAAGLGLGGNESYPEVFRPFNGFADDRRAEDGHVALSDAPGIGCERKAELYEVMPALAA
jgi:hypothetical protein